MKAKSSSQMERFSLPDARQLRSRHIGHFVHVSDLEIFFDQIVANLS